MVNLWTEAELQRHINDVIPESLNLDYKAAGSLAKTDDKRREVTKDVSAMANSDGGIIIYGISEDKTVTPSVPSQISPVDAAVISKEWLEQVINTIRPRLSGVVIHPVQLSSAPNHFAYVVEISQSTTAHQATDKRYYKRFNFESVAMDDYEIRDVMGRSQHANLELQFEIRPKYTLNQTGSYDNYLILVATIYNAGEVLAEHISTFIHLPKSILGGPMRIGLREFQNADGIVYCQFTRDNLRNDSERYGVLLPKVSREWFELRLSKNFDSTQHGELALIWRIHVDNATPKEESKPFKDLPYTMLDQRDPNIPTM